MNSQELPSLEDKLIDLLAAYDDALAKDATPQGEGSMSSELPPQLQRDLAYLQVLRQVLKPGHSPVPDQYGAETPTPAATPSPAGPVTATWNGLATGVARASDLRLSNLGRFQVRRELGRGGFGVVFLAHDPVLGREVAVKVPRAEGLLTPEFRARFQREARASAGLDHPNIVQVHEVGEVGPLCYIVSAFCPGISLSEWIKQQREPVSAGDAAEVVRTLAEAVHHAHSRGVVHRDLKPGNVLVTGSQSSPAHAAKITDFGLAKLLQEEQPGTETQSGAIVGTPQYMAPEQAAGKNREVGSAADIYALGVILYELLTGRPPFQGETPLDTLLQVKSAEPLAPTRLRPKLPRDLETICLHCLEKDPHKRYGSAEDLAHDLGRFLAGEAIRARPVGRAERVWKWARRRPALAGLVAVSLVGSLTLLILALAYLDNVARRTEAIADLSTARIQLEQIEGQRGQAQKDVDRLRSTESSLKASVTKAEAEAGKLAADIAGLKMTHAGVVKDFDALKIKSTEQATKLDKDRRDRYALTLARVRDLCETDPLGTVSLLEDVDRCPHDLRDFSWGLLNRMCQRHRLTLENTKSMVYALAVSPDGRLLVSGGASAAEDKPGDVHLWDLTTGRRLALLKGHSGWVKKAVFAPDGKTFVTLSRTSLDRNTQYGEVILWDVLSSPESTAKLRTTWKTKKDQPVGVQFSADSKTVMVVRFRGDERGCAADLWDVETSKLIGTRSVGDLRLWDHGTSVPFSRDGKYLAAAGSDVDLYRLPDLKKPVKTFEHHAPDCLVFAPVEPWLAAGGKRLVIVWDVNTGKEMANLPVTRGQDVDVLEWSPDGKYLIARGSGGSTIFEPRIGREIMHLPGHVTFSPDGKIMVNTGTREGLQVWDMTTLKRREFLSAAHAGIDPGTSHYTVVAITPDNKTLVVAAIAPEMGGCRTKLWNLGVTLEPEILAGPTRVTSVTKSGKAIELYPTAPYPSGYTNVWHVFAGRLEAKLPRAYGMNLSPDAKTMVVLTKDFIEMEVWDVATAKQRANLDHKTVFDNNVRVFSPDSKLLATVTKKGELWVWDLAAATARLVLPGKLGLAGTPVFSPDGTMLAWPDNPPLVEKKIMFKQTPKTVKTHPGFPGEVMLVNLAQGKKTASLTGFSGPVHSVLFSPDGKLLAAHSSGKIHLFETDTLRLRGAFGATSHALDQMAFSPDGRITASGRAWDVVTGKPAAPPKKDGLLSPDGRTLVTAFTLRDPVTGQERLRLVDPGSISWTGFSEDGRTLAVLSGSKIKLWRIEPQPEQVKNP